MFCLFTPLCRFFRFDFFAAADMLRYAFDAADTLLIFSLRHAITATCHQPLFTRCHVAYYAPRYCNTLR